MKFVRQWCEGMVKEGAHPLREASLCLRDEQLWVREGSFCLRGDQFGVRGGLNCLRGDQFRLRDTQSGLREGRMMIQGAF